MPRLLKPYIELVVGGTEVPAGVVHAFQVRRELSGGTDWLRLVLDARFSISPSVNDEVSLSLGFEGEGSSVFAGTVAESGVTLSERSLEAYGPQYPMACLRPSETYQQMSAGEVFCALAGDAGVATGDVSPGVDLPYYHAHNRTSALEHAKYLAQLSGVELFTKGDDKLYFAPAAGSGGGALGGAVGGAAGGLLGGGGRFQVGVNLLDVHLSEQSAAHGAVEVMPASPASQQGSDASTWLVKDSRAIAASAGDGNALRVWSGASATVDSAQSAADALATDLARLRYHGYLIVNGSPETHPGDSVSVSGLAAGDGSYEVAVVEHRMDGRRGFHSRLTLRGMP